MLNKRIAEVRCVFEVFPVGGDEPVSSISVFSCCFKQGRDTPVWQFQLKDEDMDKRGVLRKVVEEGCAEMK